MSGKRVVFLDTETTGLDPRTRRIWDVGLIVRDPGFDRVLDAFGLTYAEEDRHTAIGDARMVRDLYDKVLAS